MQKLVFGHSRPSNINMHRKSATKLGISADQISNNALKVVRRLQEHGHEAYLVGGCVRDLLVGQTPKDFDVVTCAHPEQVKKLFRNCRLIGRRFRLAHIYFSGEVIEVATFRASVDPDLGDDGHPHHRTEEGQIVRDNVYGSLEEDVWRRDFTINALYYDPQQDLILDYVDALSDINSQRIRIIGDADTRYQEDPVRMLRALRFCAKLNFSLDEATANAIEQQAGRLQKVPPARLFEECNKLFLSGYAKAAYQQLQSSPLFAILFPQTAAALDSGSHPLMAKLIELAMQDTDQRIRADKPVTPAYLFAVLLWHPLQERLQHVTEATPLPPYLALQNACVATLQAQLPSIAVPKRFLATTQEIWLLQPRFEQRKGKRPLRLLEQAKFRAAYDFLALRARAGEPLAELVTWWQDFQAANPEIQQKLVSTHGKGTGRHRHRRRNHYRKKPAKTDAENPKPQEQ